MATTKGSSPCSRSDSQAGSTRGRGASYARTCPWAATTSGSFEPLASDSSATSASTAPGTGSRRYSATASTSSAFQRSTPSTTTSRPPSPAKRPRALQAATASAPSVLSATSSSKDSSPKRARRRRSASRIFGRSPPTSRYAGSRGLSLMGRPLAHVHVEGVWGNREVPPQHRRRGHVGETWFPPRERAEGERRSYDALLGELAEILVGEP